ncbi:MAG: hypothetical protein JWN94_3516 [Betaproteobacteria bacterium]|nr:hypothetical protein [Betaproteobacteria bacterium]
MKAPITHVTRVSAGLVGGALGCGIIDRGKYQPVFVQQGDLDGACGTHCLFMALMAMRVIPRSQFFRMDERRMGTDLRRLYRLAQSFYFSGTDSRDFRKLLSLMQPKIDYEATDATDTAAQHFITNHLDLGKLVVVGLECAARKLNHWVLAIGQAGIERGKVFDATRFLIVDPSDEPDRLVPWNATLETQTNGNSRLFRCLSDLRGDSTLVRLSGAFAICRRD